MGKNSPLIIYLSFKTNHEDLTLYNWISSHSNKSGFIKDILKQVMKEELSKNTEDSIKK